MSAAKHTRLGPLANIPPDFQFTDLAGATALSPIPNATGRYTCNLPQDWAIGLVPHGGYLAAVITQAAKRFSADQHTTLQQPDLITLHQEYISACVFGQAEISITVLSSGRQYSTLRIQLFQHPNHDKKKSAILRIEALVRQGNLQREASSGGLSLSTIAPTARWPLLDRLTCVERKDLPYMFERRTAYAKVIFLLDASTDPDLWAGSEGPSIRQQWVRWRDSSKRFHDVAALAFLVDTHRPLVEAYGLTGYWFPTMSMNLDVKRSPPAEGWEWLFMRIEILECRNGRFDFDIVILDEEGQLVAVSKHVSLIVSAERNYNRKETTVAASKI